MNTATTQSVIDTLSFVKKFSGQRLLIKLGGSILDDTALVEKLCYDLSLIRSANIKVILVHGGGKAINQALATYKITSSFHEGQRITTPEIMDVVEMVLSGQVNKMLVRTLNAVGVAAVGLSGSDDNMLLCEPFSDIHHRVGKIIAVKTHLIETILASQTGNNSGTIPIISPIGVQANGQAMNINADWAASQLATALNIHKLIYLTDQSGIYDKSNQIISELDAGELEELIHNGTVVDGMLTKAKTIHTALKQGLNDIHIISAKQPHALLTELFTATGTGTVCHKKATLHQMEHHDV